jgi:hypothetical protein
MQCPDFLDVLCRMDEREAHLCSAGMSETVGP